MYDLNNVAHDFPWTAVPNQGSPVEPWRNPGSNWFDELPEGWGDVIHAYLLQLDMLVRRNRWYIYVAQVKEKFGTLRFYVDILDAEGLPCYADSAEDVKRFYELVHEMESETGRVCCHCGTREDVRCYGGWIHYACPSCEERVRDEIA
ncbi:MAG: hypothetical protein J6D34_06305 [Atopobiaceae bacterium]|nr:hypothetical protein [Atopobiaceae bacterium]